ncbi:WD repeat-containing protein 25-like [Olea europaea var. sylvestris]|uniref:WD repeat-containing protein 25-like n=1 Tax=Olea europaea var. sylvestris TaxID=158386 RepID=UPI000C1CFCEC|nr:WD repeat-containing protein 25-like [Olea europaea var. sylvestris]
MDLLCRAYSTASDDDDNGERPEHLQSAPAPPVKRAKLDGPNLNPIPKPMHIYRPNPAPNLPNEAPIPGRYVSKRERAALASAPKVQGPNPPPPFNSPPALGSLSDSDLPYTILTTLRNPIKGGARTAQIPKTLTIALYGHTKSVNTVQWSRTHAHLLASAGMDHTICIWNVWSRDQKYARVLKFHKAAVKDVKWSQQGLFVLSCGYDCMSRLIDVEKGTELQVFKEDQIVEVVRFHPHNFNLFLSGGSKGGLKLWDIRSGKVVHEYVRSLGPVLDVEFTVDGKNLITSSDVSKSNLSENSIIVWDVSRQIPLSNQVKFFVCPLVYLVL